MNLKPLKMGAAIMHAIDEIEWLNRGSSEWKLGREAKQLLFAGYCKANGWQGPVTSPSYTLCEEYDL